VTRLRDRLDRAERLAHALTTGRKAPSVAQLAARLEHAREHHPERYAAAMRRLLDILEAKADPGAQQGAADLREHLEAEEVL
jgi:hypothetical protein